MIWLLAALAIACLCLFCSVIWIDIERSALRGQVRGLESVIDRLERDLRNYRWQQAKTSVVDRMVSQMNGGKK